MTYQDKDFHKRLHSDSDADKSIGLLHYGIEYLQDSVNEFGKVLDALVDGSNDVADLEKVANNSLQSAIRYLERYQKVVSDSTLRTTITPSLIEKAECGNLNTCAVALGLAEMFGTIHNFVEVDGESASITDYTDDNQMKMTHLKLSQPLRNWILKFDANKQVEPIDIIAVPSTGQQVYDYILDIG